MNEEKKTVIFMVKNVHENNRIIEAFEMTMNSPEELYEFENEYNEKLNDYEWLDYEIRR